MARLISIDTVRVDTQVVAFDGQLAVLIDVLDHLLAEGTDPEPSGDGTEGGGPAGDGAEGEGARRGDPKWKGKESE